jgi:hypothetical protein
MRPSPVQPIAIVYRECPDALRVGDGALTQAPNLMGSQGGPGPPHLIHQQTLRRAAAFFS